MLQHHNGYIPSKRTLYVIATPIGNMRDISLRALDVLAAVDVIAAEDTRVTRNLLAQHAIPAKMMTLHQHNEHAGAEKIIALLERGESVALVTDAGTPGISDPGAILVDQVRKQGYAVVAVPGANAALCALAASGITCPHFLFYGFLSSRTAARKRELEKLLNQPYTLVFYEAPHRILDCVADLALVLGAQRQIVIARELTKLFETVHRCMLGEALAWLQADTNQQKGEFVLLLPPPDGMGEQESLADDQTRHTLEVLLQDLPLKQAVSLATGITGKNRKMLYSLALSLKKA